MGSSGAAGTAAVRERIGRHLAPLVVAAGGVREVARKLGRAGTPVSATAISKWTRGVSLPGCEVWEPLAEALDVSPWWRIFPDTLRGAEIIPGIAKTDS